MKKIILGLIVPVSLISVEALANRAVTASYGRELMAVQSRMANSGYLGRHQSGCQASVPAATADGNLSITVAFGYMDVSANPDFYDSASSLVRIGDVLDQSAKAAFEGALQGRCLTPQAKACGFKKGKRGLTKTIRDRFTGKQVSVSVQLIASSVSSSDAANKSQYANQQSKSSAAARANFLNAVQTKDVVLYVGHARSGGGPDFYPPKLTSASRVDYSSYKSQQEGLRSLVGALQGGRPKVLGVLACKSTPLFAGSLRSSMRNGTLITADELFDYNDMLPTALATVEAAVGQSCGQEFAAITGMGAPPGMLTQF